MDLKKLGKLEANLSGASAQESYMKKHSEVFNKPINAKVTLFQLEKKGFIQSAKVDLKGKGTVSFFKPYI